ncbi:hypothetical protein P43SY_010649 [Pythium insidiosum]|uniref:Integrase catalytic domain-containing protein n=1 Tax=Pythium insidiosum TaxID=114742 RepID=A0AAD5L9U0_PYTIN|nr:hypothetical protein P43SY_010649 [Pythium insidiosum]
MEPKSVALTYLQANVWVWWAENPTLYHALDQMYQAFKVTITHQQAAVLLASEKDKSRSWNQYLLYLIALCHEDEFVCEAAEDDLDMWVVDSGASRHLIRDPELLRDVEDCSHEKGLLLPDGGTLEVFVADLTPVAPAMTADRVREIVMSSNYVRVFAARKKNAAAKMFEHFLAWFENEFNCRIHVLRTDGGGEFEVVDPFCKTVVVRRKVTEAGTPQSNGKAERMNRTIFNMVRCMIFGSGLPLTYWTEAAEYAAYILNRTPTRANAKRASPIEVLTGHAPSLQNIILFGSPCMVWRDPKKKALKQHAERALIIGKYEETKGYKVVLLKDKVVTTARHVSNIETLDDGANEQILRALEEDEEAELERVADERAQNAEKKKKTADERAAIEAETSAEKAVVERECSAPKEPEPDGPRRSRHECKKSTKKAEADEQAESSTTAARLVARGDKQVFGENYFMTFSTVIPISRGRLTLVGTYVDDLLVTGTSVERVDQFFVDMAVLELKDLGEVEKYLGMRIQWSKEKGYLIDQERTIEELLERHGLKDANPVRRIARYLKGTKALKLSLCKDQEPQSPVRIVSYSDADFAADKVDRKSISAGVQTVNGMTGATAEAEFVAAAVSGREALGLKELYEELNASSHHSSSRLKFLRDYARKKVVKPLYVATKSMVADLLTKVLLVPRNQELRELIGLE